MKDSHFSVVIFDFELSSRLKTVLRALRAFLTNILNNTELVV